MPHRNQSPIPKVKDLEPRLDTTRPFMDDTGRLDALPGWGEVTVGLFLRELRGVRPGIEPPLDRRALQAAEHLRLLAGGGPGIARLREVAHEAHLDVRDLEAALVRLSLLHGHRMMECPGGVRCSALTGPSQLDH